MAQTLDEFLDELKEDIVSFEAEYRASHATNPEHYPLELPDENAGLWAEFFFDHMTRVKTGKGICP